MLERECDEVLATLMTNPPRRYNQNGWDFELLKEKFPIST